jgi:protease IV
MSPMKRSWFWGIIGIMMSGVVVLLLLTQVLNRGVGLAGRLGGVVGVLVLEGPILHADEFLEKIDAFRTADHIKGVVLRVNSPGGTVGGSQEIFHALKRLAVKKPLVASFGTIATSGGYYAGVAAEKIYALPGTITASIGVRMSHMNTEELLKLIGVQPDILKSGYFKDVGATHRPMREDERQLLTDLLEGMHEQFKADVAAARKLDRAVVDAVADGRVITGQEALKHGFIDAIGDQLDAVRDVAARVGLSDEPRLVFSRDTTPWWVSLVRGDVASVIPRIIEGLRWPSIAYYWSPGVALEGRVE